MTLFKLRGSQWYWCRWPLSIILYLLISQAHAAPNVVCTAGVNTAAGNSGVINISDNVTPKNADSAYIGGTVNYRCNNSGTAGYVSVCLGVDGGSANANIVKPRYMQSGNGSADLAFTMTLPGGVLWSMRGKEGAEYRTGQLTIAENGVISGSVPINIALISGYRNIYATEGLYTNDFSGSHTALTFSTSDTLSSPDCTEISQGVTRFPFTVQARVVPSCMINATSDINLGRHSANQTNILGSNSNAVNITCTNAAPYYIGLSPSNDNSNGAGVMTSTSSNTDKIPYQLRSTAGITGKIWGNTATSTTAGNGVANTGTGGAQSHTVYVTVPSTDVKPDTYSDTVTIHVNY